MPPFHIRHLIHSLPLGALSGFHLRSHALVNGVSNNYVSINCQMLRISKMIKVDDRFEDIAVQIRLITIMTIL